MSFEIAIDVGGTFTDLVCSDDNREINTFKAPTTPDNVINGLFDAIKTAATYYQFLSSIKIQMLSVVLMPLGWFGFWEGLSKLIDSSPAFIQDLKMFQGMSKASYQFKYIGEDQKEAS